MKLLLLFLSFNLFAQEPFPEPAPKKLLELVVARETNQPGIQDETVILYDDGKTEYTAYDENMHLSTNIITINMNPSVIDNLLIRIKNINKFAQLVDLDPNAPVIIGGELFYWYIYYLDGMKKAIQIKSFGHTYKLMDNNNVKNIIGVIDGFYYLSRL